MSLILQLLARYWYVFVAMGIAGAGVHVMESASYDRLETAFATYRAQVEKDNATAQAAARQALQAQIDLRLAAEARNEQVLHDLNDTQARADAAARGAEFARRLLQAAQAAPAGSGGHPLSEACRQPGTAPAPADSGDRRLAQELGDAAAECREAITRLRALQAEIKPQL